MVTSRPGFRERLKAADQAADQAAPGSREDQFQYGWRLRSVTDASGAKRVEYVALTSEDILKPQEGDQMAQDSLHFILILRLAGMLLRRYPLNGPVTLFSDLLTYFDDANSAAADICLGRERVGRE